MHKSGVSQFAVGCASIGLAFASQNLASNFVAGLMMLLFRPFKCGDLVRIGGVEGRVAKVGMNSTTLITEHSEEEVQFTNSALVGGPVTRLDNYALRGEIATVTLAPGTNPAEAKAVLGRAMLKADTCLASKYEEAGVPDPTDPQRARSCFMSDLGRSGEQTWKVFMHLPHDPHSACVSTLLECISVEISVSNLEHARTMY